MNQISNFKTLSEHLKSLPGRKRVAVVCADDEHTEKAIARALEEGFADFVMVGTDNALERFPSLAAHSEHVEVIEVEDKDAAAAKAVALVREGKADVLMKGLINTDNLLRAVLNKEHGILPHGRVLTHITALETPGRDKFIFFTDAAVIPCPTFEQRVAQVTYISDLCRRFGIAAPRLAMIHCSEKVNPKFPQTIDYENLKKMASEGKFGSVVVDGPMDVKTAFDEASAEVKGIDSPIGGKADALLFPDIESANTYYKTMTFFAHSLAAGMLCGTLAPVVLPSRSDHAESKYYALALACLASEGKKAI